MDLNINLAHVERIAQELNVRPVQVGATAKLIADGATVPFIARYRKEATGELDEVAITKVRDRLEQMQAVDSRRTSIVKSLEERNLLSVELKQKLEKAETLNRLEDLFAPFRPKRRTRATIAKERGLEPLADFIWDHADDRAADPLAEAEGFVDEEKEVPDVETALAGARDVLAERISDDAQARATLRQLFARDATVTSKVMFGKEEEPEAQKFRDYFDWSEPLADIPSHRMLAIRRGEKEGFLMMRVHPEEHTAVGLLERQFVPAGGGACAEQMKRTVEDSYKRLLSSSMETEARLEGKKTADGEAIRVFADNLRELLLGSPLGQKRVLAIDPGFRTGCKIVVLDPQGKLLHHDVMYLLGKGDALMQARTMILTLVERHRVEAIAIGNGTASRETEMFVNKIGVPKSIPVVMVSESGASVYSASEVAREEFPDHDVTVRGAVSIGRRLMDPLAELVKLDPKVIGVGQYQHDVDQNQLKGSLDDTVVSCVNGVGVELNTASKQLLSYVSGLNPSLAANIVAYRDENGAFSSRKQLLKVPRLGEKAFEQAAGFLRIAGAEDPLDASAVHPERYPLVQQMAADLGCTVTDLMRNDGLRKRLDLQHYVSEEVGLPTLKDILGELAKPGRDPRKGFEVFQFAEGVEKPEDLRPGMKLPGIVTNVTAFGAFVDVGVHQDGLVHVSQLADHFVKDPAEVVKVQQKVQVTVVEVDLARKRIALSMKSKPDLEGRNGGGKRDGDERGRGGRRPGGRGQGGRSAGGPRDRSSSTGGGMGNPFANL